MTTNLYDVFKTGYSNDKKKQKKFAQDHGYEYDGELSNSKHSVYVKKKQDGKNELLYNINGTQNNSLSNIARDWSTNAGILFGIKTNREKQERRGLEKAKKKHNADSATITGHSQGGFHASQIASPYDRVITYNKPTHGETIKRNETHYKTVLDPVSILTTGTKRSKVVDKSIHLNPFKDSHSYENIKDKNITFSH
jgi:hypothetical protein